MYGVTYIAGSCRHNDENEGDKIDLCDPKTTKKQ